MSAKWPPAWAGLVRDIVPARADFEKDVLAKLDALVLAQPLTAETYPLAETVLAATLRHHQSIRRPAPLAENPHLAMQTTLLERLSRTRADWLNTLRTLGQMDDALRLADSWLPTESQGSVLRSAILQVWIEQAKAGMKKSDYALARRWLDRIDETFDETSEAETIRKPLRARAELLFKEAQTTTDATGVSKLDEALSLWPRLPGVRDALAKRKGAYRTLIIAVPELPEQLSPATASTFTETQALDLMFERLYLRETQAPQGIRYRARLAETLPAGDASLSIPLRRREYWSSGERVAAADLRHTALLMNQPDLPGRTGLWREFLETPRLDSNPFQIEINLRQGLLDPLATLTFHVLPQYYRGKQLARADDADFARSPVGSGPYVYAGRKVEADNTFAVFQSNPCDLHDLAGRVQELRLIAVGDPAKGLGKALPHVVLDAPTDQLDALKKLGYREAPRAGPNARVHMLAVNLRRPSLAPVAIRRALAHALDRQALLDKHFRGNAEEKFHASANGLFPRGSWATCPAPRVPAELFHLEQARSFANQAKKDVPAVEWTLKYPAGNRRVRDACDDMARVIRALLQEAGIKADVSARGLAPRDLRKARDDRDFDLLYMDVEDFDDPVRLAIFFDPHPDAVRAGGANVCGVEGDVKLQELLRSALKHRQFTAAQTNMQAVYAHLYETMPAIPLWELDRHVMIRPNLRLPPVESRSIFARIREWRLQP